MFAKESDSRLRVAKPATDVLDELLDPNSEVRLAARPPIGDFLGLEAWASQNSGALVVVAPLGTLKQMPLDHRAGFLLSLMDGTVDLDTLIDVSGMPRDDVPRDRPGAARGRSGRFPVGPRLSACRARRCRYDG